MNISHALFLSTIIGSLFGLLVLSDSYSVVYKKGNSLNVLATSLNMRDKPSIKAQKIANVLYGAKVTVLQKTKKSYQSEGIKGGWVLVKYGRKKGYIFDGYLTKLPAPPKYCKNMEQYALKRLGRIDRKPRTIEKRSNINSDAYYSKEVQRFKKGNLIFESGYESYSETLVIKNISMEEGFLIARLCSRNFDGENYVIFRNRSFSLNSEGTIDIVEEPCRAACQCGIKVKKDSKGYTHITLWGGC